MTFGIRENRFVNGHNGMSDSKYSSPTLTGWAGIEDHLFTYDVDRMQGYADDIDTLLVFAGLFSSILSGFVVQTYQLLQQDSMQTTNQLIAFGISQYVGFTSTGNFNPAINSTIASLLSPEPFTAPTSARWINALFFTSIVLSLAAALFGIRAKQWLRKYMQWNSPLNTPRDNILVRQIRVEAWESWNIDVTISFIPALLELAMILFLAGVVLLLWTLDDIVAKAVTLVVAVFLFIIAAFTILPIFFKRCPYKSPISWAFVAASSTAASLITSYIRFLKMSLGFLLARKEDEASAVSDIDSAASSRFPFRTRVGMFFRRGVWTPKDWKKIDGWAVKLSTWRERDMDSASITGLRLGGWWQKSRDARDAAEIELTQELIHLDEDGNFIEAQDQVPIPEGHPEALLVDISQSALLVRALSWVQRESQDIHVNKCLYECIGTLHPEASLKLSNISWYSSHVVADWCIASAIFAGDPSRESQSALLPEYGSDRQKPRTVTGLRRALAVYAWGSSRPNLEEPQDDDTDFKLDLAACRPFWNNRKAESHILLLVLFADLQHIVMLIQVSSDDFSARARTLKRRSFELVSILNQALDSYVKSRRRADSYNYIDRLGPILSHIILFSIRQSESCSAATVLGLKALEVAYTIAKVTVGPEGDIVVSSGRMERGHYKALLTDYFNGNFHEYGECKLNMYIFTVVRFFNYINLAHSGSISELLSNMVAAVEASTETYPDRLRHPDIDIDDCAWIYALCAEEDFLTRMHGSTFRRILHQFEHHYRERNLIGDLQKIREYLHSSLQTAHEALEICEDEGCRWLPRSHACGAGSGYDIPDNCHLLPFYGHPYSYCTTDQEEDVSEGIGSPALDSERTARLENTVGPWRVVPARLRNWLRRDSLRSGSDVERGTGQVAEDEKGVEGIGIGVLAIQDDLPDYLQNSPDFMATTGAFAVAQPPSAMLPGVEHGESEYKFMDQELLERNLSGSAATATMRDRASELVSGAVSFPRRTVLEEYPLLPGGRSHDNGVLDLTEAPPDRLSAATTPLSNTLVPPPAADISTNGEPIVNTNYAPSPLGTGLPSASSLAQQAAARADSLGIFPLSARQNGVAPGDESTSDVVTRIQDSV